MSTVVLFGATGFLGRQVRDLLAGDERVTRLLCPGRGDLDLLAASPGEAAGLLREARPAAVLCCVGRMSGGYSELFRGNAGVAALLLEAVAAAAPRARFVRLGSAAEYGPAPYGHAHHESDPARPTSPYGISHLAGTLLVEQAREVDGLSLRVFNPVGPGISADNVLGRARDLMRSGGPVELGPLGAMRDFVDVRDVAEAVVRAAFVPEPAERVINVGSGRAVAVREAVELLAGAAGFTGGIHEGAPASGRSGAVPWSQADPGRAREVLGWRPRFPLADSIKAMW
ncbi:NAD-dependent epimerase/dehydratase family protein [Nonomuraea sp. NPDC050783]|uniref:NAD-dependent epimerase/dehydratase family protein n=1 Tax=Nonomuraea sp. NPDC050783 TaxID=3154634 RepID=UPI0034671ED9